MNIEYVQFKAWTKFTAAFKPAENMVSSSTGAKGEDKGTFPAFAVPRYFQWLGMIWSGSVEDLPGFDGLAGRVIG